MPISSERETLQNPNETWRRPPS